MKAKLVYNTNIYIDCRKLLDAMLDITPSFPRSYKFSIGSRLHEIAINLISEISAAYINKDRTVRIQHLVTFQSEFEVLKTLIRTMLEYGYSKAAICKKLKCNPKTLDDHIKRME